MMSGNSASEQSATKSPEPGSRVFVLLLLLILSMCLPYSSCAQKKQLFHRNHTTATWIPDSSYIIIKDIPVGFYEPQPPFYRDSGKAVVKFVKRNVRLIHTNPTEKNHDRYFRLAEALYELNRDEEAKEMFLKIVESHGLSYDSTIVHSANGAIHKTDTTAEHQDKYLYGYGSFTSNYKHEAYMILTRIYLEQKDFDKALKYLHLGDRTYGIVFTCGTGYGMYSDGLTNLYALCYEGLGENDKVIDLLLANGYRGSQILIRAIQAKYTPAQIKDSLGHALESLVFVRDSLPITVTSTIDWGKRTEKETTYSYISGTGEIDLFGHKVHLMAPDLGAGEVMSRDLFLSEFKRSYLYSQLAGKN